MISRAPKLIIGLGNPGKKYENTYHNVGFLAIDYLAENHPISNFPACADLPARNAQAGASAGRQFPISKLLKSNVYMNESGRFVKEALKKYGIKPETLLIIHDDSDIYLGDYKISCGRGAAGHHGVENIINSLKTQDFCRVRIGIRPISRTNTDITRTDVNNTRTNTNKNTNQCENGLYKSVFSQCKSVPRMKAENFVLKKISPINKKVLNKVFQKISEDIIKPNQKSE